MKEFINKNIIVRNIEEYDQIIRCINDISVIHFLNYDTINTSKYVYGEFPMILHYDAVKNELTKQEDVVEASEILGTKEPTAREFIKWFEQFYDKYDCECSRCVLSLENENLCLCDPVTWKGNEDKLIELAKAGETTTKPKSEKMVEKLEEYIMSMNKEDLSKHEEDFIDAVCYAIDKLKEMDTND